MFASVLLANYSLFAQAPISIRTQVFDSIPTPADSSAVIIDTLAVPVDSITKNSPIKDPVFTEATDSLIYSLDGKKVFLFGNASVKYQNIELKADYIEFDMETKEVYAIGRADSSGKVIGKPVFKEGSQEFRMEKMAYNFDTKRAKITDVITEEAGGFLHGHSTKMMEDKTVNISGGKFTTCDLDHPHFFIKINKAKVIPGDRMIMGPAYLVIGDVPFPVGLPFGFFPSSRGRASGILIPEYGEEDRRGFYIRRGGFYWGISDYVDLTLLGGIYSGGSWTLNARSGYKKRYKYSGNFSIDFSKNVFGEKGFDDYRSDQSYWLNWNHSQDPKASPNSTFQARVNMGSPSHNRYNPQSVDNFLANQISSGISYTKVWVGTPFTMSAALSHSQNNADSTISLNLPKVSFNMSRIYPFKRKSAIGQARWYEKVGLTYSAELDNSLSTKFDNLLTIQSLKKMKNGIQHRIPLSTSFTLLKYVSLSPSVNYSENWYLRTIEKKWDADTRKVTIDTVQGFRRAWQYNTGASMSTKVYGMFSFSQKSKVQAIRHVLTPSVSISYRPDFSSDFYGFYKTVQVDTTGRTQQYSIFESSIYGGPASGKSGSIGFGIGNNLEMKVRSDKDTTTNFQKIKIFDSFSLNSSYNLLADSMKLAPISVSARTTLFEKINIDASGTLNPYAMDSRGVAYNKFLLNENGSLVRLTNFRVGIGVSLNSSTQGGNTGNTGNKNDFRTDDLLQNSVGENALAGFSKSPQVDFSIPWNISIDYSFNYSKPSFEKNISQTLSFSGDVSLTKNWKIAFRSGYDIKAQRLTTSSLDIYRDLHCWEMRVSIIPIGYLKSYSFQINVKSAILQDLKLTKRDSHLNRL